ncbi:unnamed protein product (mitochondrion) [Plasmodiophora brassicae]|uniref:Uncharacterized protein n=1 Tax=Plasmodiophora brassicae TaxID=37360 RepID=A0A3P3YIX6_PLABS|nr:unnamed protein product [Plasmodiophora brassicae]
MADGRPWLKNAIVGALGPDPQPRSTDLLSHAVRVRVSRTSWAAPFAPVPVQLSDDHHFVDGVLSVDAIAGFLSTFGQDTLELLENAMVGLGRCAVVVAARHPVRVVVRVDEFTFLGETDMFRSAPCVMGDRAVLDAVDYFVNGFFRTPVVDPGRVGGGGAPEPRHLQDCLVTKPTEARFRNVPGWPNLTNDDVVDDDDVRSRGSAAASPAPAKEAASQILFFSPTKDDQEQDRLDGQADTDRQAVADIAHEERPADGTPEAQGGIDEEPPTSACRPPAPAAVSAGAPDATTLVGTTDTTAASLSVAGGAAGRAGARGRLPDFEFTQDDDEPDDDPCGRSGASGLTQLVGEFTQDDVVSGRRPAVGTPSPTGRDAPRSPPAERRRRPEEYGISAPLIGPDDDPETENAHNVNASAVRPAMTPSAAKSTGLTQFEFTPSSDEGDDRQRAFVKPRQPPPDRAPSFKRVAPAAWDTRSVLVDLLQKQCRRKRVRAPDW